MQIKDKKGVENVVADHLSRLTIAHDTHSPPINDEFLEESLMKLEKAPWYAHIANFLTTGEISVEWKGQDRKYFFSKINSYYWEEPFLFKYCADQIIRKCVPEEEQQGILNHCHESACGGHFASQKTAMKVLQSGFYWPSLFKEAHQMCRVCDRCCDAPNPSPTRLADPIRFPGRETQDWDSLPDFFFLNRTGTCGYGPHLITESKYQNKRTTTGVVSINIYTHILSPIYLYKTELLHLQIRARNLHVMYPYKCVGPAVCGCLLMSPPVPTRIKNLC